MDVLTKVERSKVMASVRSRDTKPEIAVRKMTHRMGYRYRLHIRELPGCPDMVFKSRRKVIFVHGCFWHLHKNCPNNRMPKSRQDYWRPKLERNAERDKQVRNKLRRMGWGSMVAWECQLANPSKLQRRISEFLGAKNERTFISLRKDCIMRKEHNIKQPSALEFFDKFPDEETAREYLINARWPDGIICIHCGHDEAYKMRKGALLKCKGCRKQFTARVGTVMEDSPIPIRKWLYAMCLFGIHSKGVSSVKLKDQLGITQKSAWRMLHRMRKAFESSGTVLSGAIEVDETYIRGEMNAINTPAGASAKAGAVLASRPCWA